MESESKFGEIESQSKFGEIKSERANGRKVLKCKPLFAYLENRFRVDNEIGLGLIMKSIWERRVVSGRFYGDGSDLVGFFFLISGLDFLITE